MMNSKHLLYSCLFFVSVFLSCHSMGIKRDTSCFTFTMSSRITTPTHRHPWLSSVRPQIFVDCASKRLVLSRPCFDSLLFSSCFLLLPTYGNPDVCKQLFIFFCTHHIFMHSVAPPTNRLITMTTIHKPCPLNRLMEVLRNLQRQPIWSDSSLHLACSMY